MRTSTALLAAMLLAAGPVVAQTASTATETATGTAASGGSGSGGDTAAASSGTLCTTGFSLADANHDGTVSPDEMSAANQSDFAQLDANRDGKLSESEYMDCMNKMAGTKGIETDRSVENMADADTDQSGSIDPNEYMNATHHAQQQASKDTAENGPGVILLRRFIFVPVDMGQTDLRKMSSEETAARASQEFRALDTNHDGMISSDEWAQKSSTFGDNSAGSKADYTSLDEKKSGAVSADDYNRIAQGWWSAPDMAKADAGAMSGLDSSTAASGTGGASASGTDTASAGTSGTGGSGTGTSGTDTASAGNTSDNPPIVYFRYFGPLLRK